MRMRRNHIPFGVADLLARAAAFCVVVVGGCVVQAEVALAVDVARVGGGDVASAARLWLDAGLSRAPALMLCLGLTVAVVPLALLGGMFRWMWQRPHNRYVPPPFLDDGVRSEFADGIVRVAHAEGRRGGRAWVDIETNLGLETCRVPVVGPLVRVGRDDSNEIAIADVTVHRFHALMRRAEDGRYVLLDLSSEGGNGVVLNGEAVQQAWLRSGDLIDLGRVRLRFSFEPA